MGILGHPTDGWFAQLANAGESAGRWVGNQFSSGAGDRFYNHMGDVATQKVTAINNQAINNALANGATQQQALQQGSAAMDKLANPQTVGDLGNLTATGASTAGTTVADTVKDMLPSADLGGLLMGALAIGGTLLACEACSGPSSTPTVRRNRREMAYA